MDGYHEPSMACEEQVTEVYLPTETCRVDVGVQIVAEVVEKPEEIEEDEVDREAI